MRVLVACEFSGIVRDAFLERGHDAMSCDLLPTESPGPHYEGDIRDVEGYWDLMIAHPPCTYLANSGVRWLHEKEGRWEKMEKAAKFFKMLFYKASAHRIAVENPVMHKYAVEIIGQRQDQCIQPYQFGHMEQKRTCLWLHNLPLLKPTNNVKEEMMKLPKNERERLHYLPPSVDRAKERSKTFPGIAEAMAEQWGSLDD